MSAKQPTTPAPAEALVFRSPNGRATFDWQGPPGFPLVITINRTGGDGALVGMDVSAATQLRDYLIRMLERGA